MDETCVVSHCNSPVYLLYFHSGVCLKHWCKHCDDNNKFDLKKELADEVSETIGGVDNNDSRTIKGNRNSRKNRVQK